MAGAAAVAVVAGAGALWWRAGSGAASPGARATVAATPRDPAVRKTDATTVASSNSVRAASPTGTDLVRELDAIRQQGAELATESSLLRSELRTAQAAAATNSTETANLFARHAQLLAQYKSRLDALPSTAEARAQRSALLEKQAALNEEIKTLRPNSRLREKELEAKDPEAAAAYRSARERLENVGRDIDTVNGTIARQRYAAHESDPELKAMKFDVLLLQYKLEAAVRGRPEVAALLAREAALAADAHGMDERMRALKAQADQAGIAWPVSRKAKPSSSMEARTNGNA